LVYSLAAEITRLSPSLTDAIVCRDGIKNYFARELAPYIGRCRRKPRPHMG
jgi:hypothetical protein